MALNNSNPLDPYEDLALEGTRRKLEEPDFLSAVWEGVKAPFRFANNLSEGTGNVRDIVGGAVLEGDPLAYFKLTPDSMNKTVGDDIASYLGFGEDTFQKTTTLGKELVKDVAGPASPDQGYAEAIARPIAGFGLDVAFDPATALGFAGGVQGAKAAMQVAETHAAQEALDRGLQVAGEYGPDVLAGMREAIPGLQRTANIAEKYHKVVQPIYAAGDLVDAVEATRTAKQSFDEKGWSPESVGHGVEALIAGLDFATGAPGDALHAAKKLHSKFTDPNYTPKNPHADKLQMGLESLIQKGAINPEELMDTIAASEKLHGAEEETMELPLQPAMASAPSVPGMPTPFDQSNAELNPDIPPASEPQMPSMGTTTGNALASMLSAEKARKQRAANGPVTEPHLSQENQGERMQHADDAKGHLTHSLGWDPAELDMHDPDTLLTLAEHNISPKDVEDALLDLAPKTPKPSKFPAPSGSKRTSLSPEAKSQMSYRQATQHSAGGPDPTMPPVVEKLAAENGVEFYSDKELPFLGSGAYHSTYALGKATKGPLKGQEVILRVGSERTSGGRIFKGLDEMIPVGGMEVTPDGTMLEVVPRTLGRDEIGVPNGNNWQHRFHLAKSLRSKLPVNIDIGDIMNNPGNVRYIEDPKGQVRFQGKKYKPIVSDFGVANPDNLVERAKGGEARDVDPAEIRPFYSQMEKAIDGIVERRGEGPTTARQWMQYLQSPKHEIKKAEIIQSGLMDKLKEYDQQNRPLKKRDMVRILNELSVEVPGVKTWTTTRETRAAEDGPEYMQEGRKLQRKRDAAEDKYRAAQDKEFELGKDRFLPENQAKLVKYRQEAQAAKEKLENLRSEYEAYYHRGQDVEIDDLPYAEMRAPGPVDDYGILSVNLNTHETIHTSPSGHDMGLSGENRIAHVRYTLRKDESGKQYMLLDEVQNDWGQSGNKQGFEKPELKADREAKAAEVHDKMSRLGFKYDQIVKEHHGINEKLAKAIVEKGEPGMVTLDENFKPTKPNLEDGDEWTNHLTSAGWDEVNQNPESIRHNDLRESLSQEYNELEVKLRTLERKGVTPGPYVMDTNLWTSSAIRNAIEQAVKKGIDTIAIPTPQMVEHAEGVRTGDGRYNEYYGTIIPSNLKKVARELGAKIDTTTHVGEAQVKHRSVEQWRAEVDQFLADQGVQLNRGNSQNLWQIVDIDDGEIVTSGHGFIDDALEAYEKITGAVMPASPMKTPNTKLVSLTLTPEAIAKVKTEGQRLMSRATSTTGIGDMASEEAHPLANNPPSPEAAGKMADSIAQTENTGERTTTPGWDEAIAALQESWDKAAARGLEDIMGSRSEFFKKGITSFIGRKLTKGKEASEIAYMQSMLQAPMEVGQIIGMKDGKIAFHRAFTSSRAKSFNSSHKVYQDGLRAVEKAVAKGEIDGYYTSHNHSGDVAEPSPEDMSAISEYSSTAPKGYLGEIITNGTTWNHIPPDKSMVVDGEGFTPAPSTWFKPKELYGAVPRDNPDTLDVIYRSYADRIGTERTYSPKSVAEHGKLAFAAGHGVSFIGIGGDGSVLHIMGMPAEAFAKMKTGEIKEMLTSKAAGHGVMSWALASNLEPDSTLQKEVAFKATAAKNMKAPVAGHMNIWKGAGKADIHRTTDIRITNDENPTKTLRLLSAAKSPDAKAKAIDAADDFIMRKLTELTAQERKPQVEENPDETSRLAGELNQSEIGPPDITQKPGQGGEGPINVKHNLKNMSDEGVRTELAASLKAKNLDRDKAQPTQEEVEAAYADLRSRMSADELHETVKLTNTKNGMVALHERFNNYRDAVRLEQAARADWQQLTEAGVRADEAKSEWVKAGLLKEAALKDFANAKTTVGRMLNYLKTVKEQELVPGNDRLGALLSSLRKRGVKESVIDKLIETYKTKPEEFATQVNKALDPGWLKAFLQLWKAGLLSGPPTRLANIGSNSLWRGVLDMNRNFIVPGFDILRSKLTGTEQERFYGEAEASLLAYKQHLPFAMRQWLADKGGFTFNDITSLEGGKTDLKPEGAAQYKFRKNKVFKGYADFMDTFFKGLNVDDTFAKQLAAAQAAYRIAYREARKGGNSHESAMEAFPVVAQEMMEGLRNPLGEMRTKHAENIEKILAMAKEETFQAPLGDFGKRTQEYIQKHPLLQLVVPFYETPINILKETLKATPFGYFFGEKGFRRSAEKVSLEAMRNGNIREAFSKLNGEDIEEFSKMMMGVYITGFAGLLGAMGAITGGGPGDPRKEAELRKTGWQPYSIKIGDKFYNYQRLEPLSGVLGIAADMVEAAKNGQLDLRSDKGKKAMTQLMASTFDNMLSKTFLAGFEGLATAVHDPKRYGARFIKQMEGSLVPNIVGRTAQAIDPQFRETDEGWTDPIRAKIPFYSKTLEGQTTSSGQPRYRPGGPIARFLNPIITTTEEHTPEANLSREMVRVNYLPTTPRSFLTVGGKQIPLTNEEQSWLKEAKQEGQRKAKVAIKDPSYLRLPDNEEDPRYRIGMSTKQDVLERIFKRYRKVAQDKINIQVRRRALKGMY